MDDDILFVSATNYYNAYTAETPNTRSEYYDKDFENHICGHFVCRGFEGLKAIGIEY